MGSEKNKEIPQVEGLEFEEETHTYRLDGILIPSVSAIMEPLSRVKYTGISESTLKRAANKGTAVHNAIENWLKFGIEDVSAEHQGYFEGFKQWKSAVSPEIIGSEIHLCHRLMRYGGTADLLAYIENDLVLVDIKTTYTISDMTCGVQLEAYAQALSSMGVGIQRKIILHLKRDGKFDVREYPAPDAERWRVFGALKTVFDYIESTK